MLKKKEVGISKLWVALNPLNEGWYAKKSFFIEPFKVLSKIISCLMSNYTNVRTVFFLGVNVNQHVYKFLFCALFTFSY